LKNNSIDQWITLD